MKIIQQGNNMKPTRRIILKADHAQIYVYYETESKQTTIELLEKAISLLKLGIGSESYKPMKGQ